MGFLQLTGGAYTARSLVAAAQRCLNLYIEAIPQDTGESVPTTHYCTPGLTFAGNSGEERCRGLYTSFDGTLYAVYNQSVFRIDENNQLHSLGRFQGTDPSDAADRDTPVSMCDNGAILLIVDGTVDGYFVDITKKPGEQTLIRIDRGINQGFLGADHVSFQDTFFLLNKPDSAQFYISLSNINADNMSAVANVYFTALHSVTPTGNTTVGSPIVTAISSMSEVVVGMAISGLGILNGSTIASIDSVSQITMNTNAIVTNTGTNLTISETSTGSRYTVNDVLDLPGTGGAQVTVNAVDNNGAITAWGTTNAGAVITKPANPVSTTGGTGTGARFDVTYQDNVGGFDAFDFAAMTGQANKLVAAETLHRNVWLIGTTSFEVWINSGGEGSVAGSFPFIIYQDAFGNWGCAAKYSVAPIMNQLFWLAQDKFGQGIVMRGEALTSKRISTHAIEQAIREYPKIDDAIGMTYQQNGHAFYMLTFPSANNSRGATWCFDATTNMWHERCFIDENGIEYRHVANAISAAYGRVYVGDWRNGNLYTFDLDNYTDNGWPIKRLRSFPHQVDLESNRRVMYQQLIANMQVGSASNAAATSSVISTDFVAPDGTLLEDYHNINSIGATFTQISGEGEIVDDAVVQSDSGTMLYLVSGAPTIADYSVSFTMTPTGYEVQPRTGQSMFTIARADGSDNGYKTSIVSDGSAYSVVLTIMPSTTHPVSLGTLTGGSYRVITNLKGSTIAVSVLRTEDGLWATSSGTWATAAQSCIIIEDGTYTTPGRILLGATAGATMALAQFVGQQVMAMSSDPVVVGSASPVLSGFAATAGLGTPSINGSVAPVLSGRAAAATVGAVAPSSLSSLLTGRSATASSGTPTVGAGPSLSLTGRLATASSGTVLISRSQSPSVTGRSATASSGAPSVSSSISPPAQASAAGYTHLVFNDDFTTTSTIASGQNSTSGYNWYWAQRLGSPANPSEWHVATTATAASISNGNTSGGANASAVGGILQINTGNFPNANLISLPGWAMNSGLTGLPATGTGHWGRCYMEAYIQFLPDQNAALPFNPTNFPLIGWPAFWSWAAEGLSEYGFPGSGLSLVNPTEVDFLESFGNVTFGGPATPGTWDAGIIHHDTDGSDGLGHGSIDAEWHTYGFLWTTNHVRIYFDQSPMTAALALSPTYALDAQTLFLTLGTGPSWQMNIDWVRVWQ